MAQSYPIKKTRTTCQAALLQGLCFEAAISYRAKLASNPDEPLPREDSQAIASLVKSWDIARDAVRVAKGKPLPGSLRPKPTGKPKRTNGHAHADPTGPAMPDQPARE